MKFALTLTSLVLVLSVPLTGCALIGAEASPTPSFEASVAPTATEMAPSQVPTQEPTFYPTSAPAQTPLASLEVSPTVEIEPAQLTTPLQTQDSQTGQPGMVLSDGEDPYANDAVNLFIHCNCPAPLTENQRIVLNYGWSATTPQQAQKFLDVVDMKVKLNGKAIPDAQQYWDPIMTVNPDQEFPYLVSWHYSIPAWSLPTGYYRAEAVVEIDEPYSDGATEFEPGEIASGFVDFQITKAPVEKQAPPCVPFSSGGDPLVNLTTSGCIHKDEIWRDEISITGDITLAEGVTLTIEPGTVVKIAANRDDLRVGEYWMNDPVVIYDDPIGSREWARSAIKIDTRAGTLHAEGAADNPIVFQNESGTNIPAGWEGLEIGEGILKYAHFYNAGRDAVRADRGGVVEIAYNEMHGCGWSCIRAGSGDWVHHNTTESGAHQAILLRGNALAEHNTILRSNTGIAVEDAGGAIARNNIVIDSTAGIVLRSGEQASVLNNTIVHASQGEDGGLYQGGVIYPRGYAGEGGIVNLGVGAFTILNNIVSGVEGCGVVLEQPISGKSAFGYNLFFEVECFLWEEDDALQGSNTYIADPRFVNPSEFDFHLMPDSPAIDAGVPDLKDADGSPSDLGAYGGPQGAAW